MLNVRRLQFTKWRYYCEYSISDKLQRADDHVYVKTEGSIKFSHADNSQFTRIYLLNKHTNKKLACTLKPLSLIILSQLYILGSKVDDNEQSTGNEVHNYDMSYLFDLGQIP